MIIRDIEPKMSTEVGKSVLKRIDNKLLERINIQDFHIAASLLDPNLKNVHAIEIYIKKDHNKKDILNLYCNKFGTTSSTGDVSSSPEVIYPAEHSVLTKRSELLDFMGASSQSCQAPTSLEMEIDQYLSASVTKTNPIEWWKSNGVCYPTLKKLHDAFLCIPPSSAFSERAFKKSSKILRHDRSKLAPDKVNMLCFINSNVSIMEENLNICSLK
jgi:hypothetical protein